MERYGVAMQPIMPEAQADQMYDNPLVGFDPLESAQRIIEQAPAEGQMPDFGVFNRQPSSEGSDSQLRDNASVDVGNVALKVVLQDETAQKFGGVSIHNPYAKQNVVYDGTVKGVAGRSFSDLLAARAAEQQYQNMIAAEIVRLSDEKKDAETQDDYDLAS